MGSFVILFFVVTVLLVSNIYLILKVRSLSYRWELLKKEVLESSRQKEILNHLYYLLKMQPGLLPPTRDWAASPDVLLELFRECISEKPKKIIECGCGVSTIVLAQYASENKAHVFSLENSEEHAFETKKYLKEAGLEEYVSIIHAPIIKHEIKGEVFQWYDLSLFKEESVDFIFIDGPPYFLGHLARYPAGPLLFPKLSKGGGVLLDDALREGEKACVLRWMSEFSDFIKKEIRTEKGAVLLKKK